PSWIYNQDLVVLKRKIGRICYCVCIYDGEKNKGLKQRLLKFHRGTWLALKVQLFNFRALMHMAGYARKPECTVWFENPLLIQVIVGIPLLLLSLFHLKLMIILTSTLILLIYVWIPIERVEQAGSMCKKLILLFALRISQLTQLFNVKVNVLNTKI